jgi:hypothetical protein
VIVRFDEEIRIPELEEPDGLSKRPVVAAAESVGVLDHCMQDDVRSKHPEGHAETDSAMLCML